MKEGFSEKNIPNQIDLWNNQHMYRGTIGVEANELRDTPNNTAKLFTNHLNYNPSNILEIGCANGRDARYWASLGHTVICADFSSVALNQLNSIAIEQGIDNLLKPVLHDVNSGKLPPTNIPLHGFYSRSSLHVNDTTMISLAKEIDKKIISSGTILIEGKGDQDHKIKRSTLIDDNLIIDPFENGHIRRVWTKNFVTDMCNKFNWRIKSIEEIEEIYDENNIKFLRFIAYKP